MLFYNPVCIFLWHIYYCLGVYAITPKAKKMDLHNNSIGYYLGNQAIINDWSEEELLNNVINAANNGKLQIGL